MNIVELIGWLGATLLLSGFTLNILGKITAASTTYLILNVLASGLLLYNAWAVESYPFVVVNGFWVGVSSFKLAQKSLN